MLIRCWMIWRKSLIVKVLGRSFTYQVLEQRVQDLWKLEWEHELVDLESRYYLVLFRSKKDYEYVLNDGPWMVMGNYLTTSKWRLNFRPAYDQIHSTLAWIHFPRFPLSSSKRISCSSLGGWWVRLSRLILPPCLLLGGNLRVFV